jgi:hypothetical protein
MRALVYHGPGQKAWADRTDPEILVPASFELARPGGRIANIGGHGELGGGWLPPDKTADLQHCYGI